MVAATTVATDARQSGEHWPFNVRFMLLTPNGVPFFFQSLEDKELRRHWHSSSLESCDFSMGHRLRVHYTPAGFRHCIHSDAPNKSASHFVDQPAIGACLFEILDNDVCFDEELATRLMEPIFRHRYRAREGTDHGHSVVLALATIVAVCFCIALVASRNYDNDSGDY